MIYKNIKIHNAAELIDIVDGVAWKRLPSNVCNSLEMDSKQTFCTAAAGGVGPAFVRDGNSHLEPGHKAARGVGRLSGCIQ